MKYIYAKELYNLLRCKNILLCDLRTKEEFKKGHIKSSFNIPFNNLIKNYSTLLNKNNTYYLICDEGKLAEKASLVLTNKNYDVIIVHGGYKDWTYSLTKS